MARQTIRPFFPRWRLGALWFLLTIISGGWTTEWHIDPKASNRVIFISKAPLEEFEGVTSQIDGYLYWKGDSILADNSFYFEVDLNSLDTGIGLRNRHMRENFLETDRWPVAKYQGKMVSLTPIGSVNNKEYRVLTEGNFFVHGVERPIQVEVVLRFLNDNNLYVKGEFQLHLTDYRIKIPRVVFFKLSEIIRIRVNLYLQKIIDNGEVGG